MRHDDVARKERLPTVTRNGANARNAVQEMILAFDSYGKWRDLPNDSPCNRNGATEQIALSLRGHAYRVTTRRVAKEASANRGNGSVCARTCMSIIARSNVPFSAVREKSNDARIGRAQFGFFIFRFRAVPDTSGVGPTSWESSNFRHVRTCKCHNLYAVLFLLFSN